MNKNDIRLLTCKNLYISLHIWWYASPEREFELKPSDDCRLSYDRNRSRNMRSNYHSATQSLPPKKSVPFHHLSSVCLTSFPFLQFSTAAFRALSLQTISRAHQIRFPQLVGQLSLAFTVTSSNKWNPKIWELESWFMIFLPITFQLFALNGFDFIL